MKSILRILAIATMVVVLSLSATAIFAACEKQQSGDLTVTDLTGRQITLDVGGIRRVVCVGAGALRLYSYVGDMDKVCAVEEIEGSRTTGRVSQRAYQIRYEDLFRNLIEGGNTVGAGGPAAQVLNVEAIAKAKPDIVFSCLTLDREVIEAGEKAIGCPIVSFRYGQQKAFSEEVQTSLRLIGRICGTETRANELCEYMNALKADLAQQGSDKTSAKVYLACNSNWGVKGFLSTAKKYPLFTASGVQNVMDGEGMTLSEDGYADLEKVLTSGADKIILDAGGLETFRGEYEETGSLLPASLATMPAFSDGEIYLIMPNNAYDANVETYFINAYYVLSVAYGVPVDIRAKADEICTRFLGRAMYDDITIYGGYGKLNIPAAWPQK